MRDFVYEATSGRILFGAGRVLQLPEELDRLRIRRPMLITTSNQRDAGEQLATLLGSRASVLYDGATMHTPTDVTMHALRELQAHECDGLVALGGGSTIGLSKALALRTALPQVAIPTTYAGSEVTPILGETADGVKKTRRDPQLLPQVVIYDVEQTLSLPAAVTASSGVNAIAHAAEALYAKDRNPVISLLAREGISALARSLPALVEKPGDLALRSDAQYGGWLCGTCLGAVGMALHHKLCHVLGGSFDLPHAQTHAIVLPYALAYNAAAVPEAMDTIRMALGTRKAPWIRLHELLRDLQLPVCLAQIGMPRDGIERALDLVMRESYWNPRPMERDALNDLLLSAHAGNRPEPS